jgi:hypothetical protein
MLKTATVAGRHECEREPRVRFAPEMRHWLVDDGHVIESTEALGFENKLTRLRSKGKHGHIHLT